MNATSSIFHDINAALPTNEPLAPDEKKEVPGLVKKGSTAKQIAAHFVKQRSDIKRKKEDAKKKVEAFKEAEQKNKQALIDSGNEEDENDSENSNEETGPDAALPVLPNGVSPTVKVKRTGRKII